MRDELELLARAHRAYLRAPPGHGRVCLERVIDSLTTLIMQGRTFADDLADPAGRPRQQS